jgi:hypothetical protein
MKRIIFPPLLLFCFIGLRLTGQQPNVVAAGTHASVIAHATVYFLGIHGRRITSAKAGQSIRFGLKFTVPQSFPSGYTDVRFTVFVHGKAERTVIYGAAKRLRPRKTFQIVVPATIARSWHGSVRVVGTVTLLSKPGGASLDRAGRGSALLSVIG